jgi:hypothetical protein
MPRGMRGTGVFLPKGNEGVGMPVREFLYTVDQISVMLDLTVKTLMNPDAGYIYFVGRSIGTQKRSLMVARNIAPEDEKPDWRIPEREFIRWMRLKGFKYYDRGAFA